jgi:putative nucleotidyltransferase-like protein
VRGSNTAVTDATARPDARDRLCKVLTGDLVRWQPLGLTTAEFLAACNEHELTGLIDRRVRAVRDAHDWPPEVLAGLEQAARTEMAAEFARQLETVAVLEALAEAGTHPILLKGTALAYTAYEGPSLRPRCDTDLLVRREDCHTARRVLTRLGYVEPPFCAGEFIFHQFPLTRSDRYGLSHTFDVHWKISTQAVFADLVTYHELIAEAVHVPALGPHARCAGPVHALLLACVHPVMHHRNDERLVWTYDVHLMVSRLSTVDIDRFVDLAIRGKIAAICARQLALARARFHSGVPLRVIDRLGAVEDEPSADYLQPDRRWLDELRSNLRHSPSGRDRLGLLREIIFPGRRYMLDAYGFPPGVLPSMLLPALYAHRIVFGLTKIIARRK